jgi:dTDP-4-amino-4,6-dideoxygalactose transaminase
VSGVRHVAPAGAPIRATDLVRWARLAGSKRDLAEVLRQSIGDRFGVRHSFVTSTGRAGLTLLLRALRRLAPSDRDEVILPSYTCFSVAASVVKAGLRPRLVDISLQTLDYAPDRLRHADFTRVLAVIATNLYGLPNDLPAISAIARPQGAFVIDDAAQAMGASLGGTWSGTWGDAGLFSLDKGKNVSAIDGGIVVTNSDDVAAALAAEMTGLRAPGFVESSVGVFKAVGYFAMLRPWLYGIPTRIPQLGLGQTVFTTDFALELPSRPLAALGVTMLTQLERFTETRRANASALLEGLTGAHGIQTITPTAGAVPAYLRLPVLLADASARRHALDTLNGIGIGASASYPTSLADIAELQGRFAGSTASVAAGRQVARTIVTLPTHAFVTAGDVRRTIGAITGRSIAA